MRFSSLKDDSGYAITFILMVTFVVTTLLVSILMIVYFTNLQAVKRIEKRKIDLACYSALQKILSGDPQTYNLNNFNINNVTMNISYSMRGLFKQVTITGKTKNDSSKVEYLLADKVSYPFDNALILSQPNLNATVAGVTKITGNILVTRKAIQRGSIFGIRNSNENYLDGNINVDQNLETKFYDDSLLLNVLYKQPPENTFTINKDYILNNESLPLLDSLHFVSISGNLIIEDSTIIAPQKPTKIPISIFVHGNTTVGAGTYLNFPVNIYSDSSVFLEENASLKNSIVSSRGSIIINKDCYFEGCQFFSMNNIEVSQSKFEYPSILGIYVNTTKSSSYKDEIQLKSSILNGSILLLSAQAGLSQNKSKILINDSSKVQGLIYSENNVDISSNVIGIVYTYQFWFYKEPSEYINWLVNLNLDRKKLNQWFLLPVGFKTGGTSGFPFSQTSSFADLSILRQEWIY
jgi:hypothetical protein